MSIEGSKIKATAIGGGVCALLVLGATSGVAALPGIPTSEKPTVGHSTESWCNADLGSVVVPDLVAVCQGLAQSGLNGQG